MGAKHKHYDVIVAWAAGEEIEIYEHEKWRDWGKDYPPIYEDQEYRIKPKRIKKEGWVNVYDSESSRVVAWTSHVYLTVADAEQCAQPYRKACIRIEWEEEV